MELRWTLSLFSQAMGQYFDIDVGGKTRVGKTVRDGVGTFSYCRAADGKALYLPGKFSTRERQPQPQAQSLVLKESCVESWDGSDFNGHILFWNKERPQRKYGKNSLWHPTRR